MLQTKVRQLGSACTPLCSSVHHESKRVGYIILGFLSHPRVKGCIPHITHISHNNTSLYLFTLVYNWSTISLHAIDHRPSTIDTTSNHTGFLYPSLRGSDSPRTNTHYLIRNRYDYLTEGIQSVIPVAYLPLVWSLAYRARPSEWKSQAELLAPKYNALSIPI